MRKAHELNNIEACVFCKHQANPEKDAENLILKRLEYTLIMLNLFPYNVGHVLAIPYEHTNTLNTLPLEARRELMEATSLATEGIEKAFSPNGFNIGMNLGGKIAGGSIPDHLHMHIVPRFVGDTNFLVVLADTKVIDQSPDKIFNELKKFF